MIVGERIRLRPIRRSDLELLQAWEDDVAASGSYNFFGLKPAEGLLHRFDEKGLLDDHRGTLLVETLADQPLGTVSWHPVQYGPNAASRALNIGIGLIPIARGQGYGAEAQRLLAGYLFATYPVARVEASTDVTNLAEQRALEKAGFTRDGVLRQAQWRAGAWHDLVVYSKLRGE